MPGLGPADHESVARASAALHEQGWSRSFSLNEMMQSWALLVRAVERGYDESVDEYTNDISCRKWLGLVWPMVTEPVRAAHQDTLDQLDSRFTAATTPDDDQKLGQFYRVNESDPWWLHRLPARRLGEFAIDLDT